jgi:hypothetical protein
MDCTQARHDRQVAEIPEDQLKKPQLPPRNSPFVGVKNQEKIAPNSTASKNEKRKASTDLSSPLEGKNHNNEARKSKDKETDRRERAVLEHFEEALQAARSLKNISSISFVSSSLRAMKKQKRKSISGQKL